jgi:hypothetical protein
MTRKFESDTQGLGFFDQYDKLVYVGGITAVILGGLWCLLAFVSDSQMTSSAAIEQACKSKVEQRLVAPATVEYVSTKVDRGGGEATVRGELDSQNKMGAMIRSSFQCQARDSDSGWIIDGVNVQQR